MWRLLSRYEEQWIRIACDYGHIVRVREGWYATPLTDPRIVEACRIGGRLACVSALGYHGLLLATGVDGLHVELKGNHARPIAPGDRSRARLHWARRPSPGDDAVVDPESAMRQWIRCRARCSATQ